MAIPIIGIIGFWITAITFIVYYFKNKRLSLNTVEMDKSAFNYKKKVKQLNALKFGMVLVLGAAGFVVGAILESLLWFDDGILIVPMTIIGAGAGLILYYTYSVSIDREDVGDEDVV